LVSIVNREMDMTMTTEAVSHEDVLDAMAEVMERQARVARGEAALATAKRRLGESLSRLSRLHRARGESLDPAALHAIVSAALEGRPPGGDDDAAPSVSLRVRILTVMQASPDEVFTPARLAPEIGSKNRDSVRNTLLVLASKGKIEKVSAGKYRAQPLAVAP
jgi:hypothetical protein